MVRLTIALAALALGCSSGSGKKLVIPYDMHKTQPAAQKPAVVRMSENGRVWEMELPESQGGYEMRVPLGGGNGEQLTPADLEILDGPQAPRPAVATAAQPETKTADGTAASVSPTSASAQAVRASYLAGLAKVTELYRARRFELALIEAVNLEKDYPEEARVHAIKGSLYVKLGKPKLARQSYQKALAINPSDVAVAEALKDLQEEGK